MDESIMDKYDNPNISVTLSEENWEEIINIIRLYLRNSSSDWIDWGESINQIIQEAIDEAHKSKASDQSYQEDDDPLKPYFLSNGSITYDRETYLIDYNTTGKYQDPDYWITHTQDDDGEWIRSDDDY